jgi:F-type H+-transporting ATPase subunit epsilon
MSFELTIVAPDGEWYRGPVDSVVLPGSEGEFAVLPNHERFLAPLRVGEVEIRTPADRLLAAIASGFAVVTGDEVAVMVDSCEFARDIDVPRAESARERAERGLAEPGDPGEDRFEQYRAALERAQNRLAVSRKTAS